MKLLYSTPTYQYLLDEVLSKNSSLRAGSVERQIFPDGEHYYRIKDRVEKEHCIIISGTQTNDMLMEMHDLGSSFVKMGCRKLTFVIPYFAYQTMERAVKEGEVVTAKTRAELLSNVHRASYGNRVALIDLHTETITNFFEGDIVTTAISTNRELIPIFNECASGGKFVLATTDVGRAKTVDHIRKMYEEAYRPDLAFAYKRRSSGESTELMGINGDVEGRVVIIYDDMIRTGGSLIQAAQAYKSKGATKIFTVSNHGVFPDGAVEKIQACGAIEKIFVSNSHPRAVEMAGFYPEFIQTYSVAGAVNRYLSS